MIDVTCPRCSTVYHSREADVGKHILCTKCGFVVSIVLPANRAVVQQPTAIPSTRSTQGNRPANKHRRIYALAIVAVLVVAVVTVSLLTRHPSTPSQPSQTVKNDEFQVVDADAPTANKQTSDEPKPDPRPSEYNSLPTGTRIEGDIGSLALYSKLSEVLPLQRSYEMPKEGPNTSPNTLVWLQFGSDVKWTR